MRSSVPMRFRYNLSMCPPPTASTVVCCLTAFQGYGGVVVLDDIRAVKWPLMHEYWRNGVPASVTKVDVTEYGRRALHRHGRVGVR